MRIYTRTGDKGETSLYGGQRLPKDALRIEAYGTVDELNSVLGIARAENSHPEIDQLLDRIQNTLFVLGADLATPRSSDRNDVRRISRSDAELLEQEIDKLENSLQPLRNFILPGGAKPAAHLQLARAVCRRAERCVVRLAHNEDIGEDLLVYLNRLSDFLFVLSRFANLKANAAEHPWRP
jgi:cob(I)alamin adenosyltransferase